MASTVVSRVAAFWFNGIQEGAPLPSTLMKLWFGKDDAVDAKIKSDFEADIKSAADGKYAELEGSPEGILTLIILFDQFTRNIYRNTPQAFAFDPLARKHAKTAIQKGFDLQIPHSRRAFFYLPLEHSESLDDQRECLKKFEEMAATAPPHVAGIAKSFVNYAKSHLDIIEKFGRFPHRNEILGRTSTPEEIAHVKEHGGF